MCTELTHIPPSPLSTAETLSYEGAHAVLKDIQGTIGDWVVIPLKGKQSKRQGPSTSFCVREPPGQTLPHKTECLGDSEDSRLSSCTFPDVSTSACLSSVSGRGGMGQLLTSPSPQDHPSCKKPVASSPPSDVLTQFGLN